MTKTIKYEVDSDDIATLTIDLPGRSMNVIDNAFSADFEALIDKIIGNDAIKGAIITSGKPTFMAGADLSMMEDMSGDAKATSIENVFTQATSLSRLLRKLETCGKPLVAAVNGLAMGGGLEIVLACHYRVVADNPKIQLSTPEVKVGLLPGAGGTQRLPRLMGVQAALPYLSQGKSMSPQEALAMKVIQEVVPADQLLSAAKAWLNGSPDAVQPWDKKGFKTPGGQGHMDPRIAQTFMAGNGMLQKQSLHNYPAPQAVFSCVYEGHQVPMDAALRIEGRYFTKLLLDPTSTNMIRSLFVNKQAADKLIRRPKHVDKTQVKKLGILGAGMMGAGIAYVSARAGIDVVLLDTDQAKAEMGKNYSGGLVEKSVKRKKISEKKGQTLLDRITATTNYDDLAGCDLVIEAVFESRDIKADVTKQTEGAEPNLPVFASNTSTLPITGLAEAFSRPMDFIGIHFFSPVDKMPLVEIIMGEKTGEEALARSLDYAQQIGKTPIVVNDSRGFYTSRCFGTYVNEGLAMIADRVTPALIENGGKFSGMPVGPLAVGDEVSIELSHKVREQTKKDIGDQYRPQPGDEIIDKLIEMGRLGRKTGKGYYDYPEDGKKHIWPGLSENWAPAEDQPSLDEVKKRFLYRQAIEAARCLEEGVLRNVADGDIGAILGWGFAPYTGGPLSMIDTIGLETFVRECERMAQQYGERFAPPQLLRDMAAKGETFYGPTSVKQAV